MFGGELGPAAEAQAVRRLVPLTRTGHGIAGPLIWRALACIGLSLAGLAWACRRAPILGPWTSDDAAKTPATMVCLFVANIQFQKGGTVIAAGIVGKYRLRDGGRVELDHLGQRSLWDYRVSGDTLTLHLVNPLFAAGKSLTVADCRFRRAKRAA